MVKRATYENFPAWMVGASVAFSLAMYGLGAYILSGLGLVFLILYLCYCLFIEFNLMKKSCADCFYYGKFCGLGRGKLCPLRRSSLCPSAGEIETFPVFPAQLCLYIGGGVE